MAQMQGLTVQELADLYDRSSPEVQQWMHENIQIWRKEKENSFKTAQNFIKKVPRGWPDASQDLDQVYTM